MFEAIAEHIPDAVVFADCDGVIRFWNRGAEAVFGFAAQDVLGESLDVIVPELLRAAHWAGFRRAIESGHAGHSNQVRTTRSLHKDGRKLYVDLSFGVVADAAGRVEGSVAVGRDVSDRYLAEKALRERVATLEKPAS
ncbi:PAS domain S-box protein [Methylibium sp.]|uniref:PAS domain-containing protein n=1 Tax=Methylibium sp. TaxID=2067992 RepID=UPI0025D1B294|nr:PAS domain S-box protein [Methylibium sp.]